MMPERCNIGRMRHEKTASSVHAIRLYERRGSLKETGTNGDGFRRLNQSNLNRSKFVHKALARPAFVGVLRVAGVAPQKITSVPAPRAPAQQKLLRVREESWHWERSQTVWNPLRKQNQDR
jgi:hypothetical protein